MLFKETVSPALWGLLESLSEITSPFGFALAGGTNLALRIGHRQSIDLDFFCLEGFEKEDLKHDLHANYGDQILLTNETNQSLRYLVNGIKAEFLLHQYPLINKIETIDLIRFYSLADVAAMKMNAVIGRGAKKDFWDVAALLKEINLQDLISLYHVKYSGVDNELILRSLSYFEDADNEADPASLIGTNWKSVKEKISAAVKQFVG